ncbi:MAG: hypothetical protein L6437_09865 [Kiritimatiellae bacterium]|nr:hypothetical protein [Verrucomicrobiota bacterium]MCG2660538.1 hypothetical protein [Kiritimatiellia bacterium]
MKNIRIRMIVLVVWVAGFIRLVGAETNAASPVLVNDTFDEWEWQPITFSMMQEGRKLVAAGGEPAYEYQGPLFREPAGFGLPAGRMVEGPEAYKDRSMLLDATRGRWEVGYHDHYGHLLKPGNTYTYAVALKGKGKFHFQGWVQGFDPATAQYKWLEFPDFIAVPVTNAWKIYTGSFTIKKYNDTQFKVDEIGAAIVVNSNDVIYVDNFRISK